MKKKAVSGKTEVLFRNLAGGSEESSRNPVRIVNVSADIQTGHISSRRTTELNISV
jgi:hypothetical protein